MINDKKHIVIIGSGLGGLVCGAILSRNGYRVTILEQHHTAGGCLQSFVRKGVKFDTGMHYVGSMNDGGALRKFWEYIGLTDKVGFEELDENGFDVIEINGKEYRYAMGTDSFVNNLAQQFPEQRDNIKKYIDRIRDIASHSIFFGKHTSTESFLDNDYLKLSINKFLDEISGDEELKNVLIGNNLLLAGEKDKTPIYLNALINASYIEGAYRIIGGSDKIASELCRQIVACGSQVQTRAKVVRIETEENVVKSVLLADGTQVMADYFISNIHPSKTLSMTGTPVLRKSYRERILHAENTKSVFAVYIIFNKDRVPYQKYNYYNHQSADVWQSVVGEFGNSYLYMHQCEEKNQKYAHSAMVMAIMEYADVARWENVANRHNNKEYKDFKAHHAEILLARLEQRYPNIRDDIESFYTSSPLTYSDYTNAPDGTIYGTALDITKPLSGVIAHWTKLTNLMFVGQNTYAHGMLGVVISAIIVCGEFLGVETIINEINDK